MQQVASRTSFSLLPTTFFYTEQLHREPCPQHREPYSEQMSGMNLNSRGPVCHHPRLWISLQAPQGRRDRTRFSESARLCLPGVWVFVSLKVEFSE